MRVLMVLFVLLMTAFLSSDAMAQKLEDKTYDAGVTVAYWTGGEISVGAGTGDKDGSFLFRAFADSYIMPKLAFGAYFNYAPYTQEGEDIDCIEFGASIKPRFILDNGMAVKPGLNIGYRIIGSSVGILDDSDGLGLNLSIEIQKQMDQFIVHGEFGFLSQPAGGNEYIDLTWAPIIYFGGGISL